MERPTLTATKRTVSGKKVEQLRRGGKLPAVLYGHGLETLNLEIDEKDFLRTFKKAGESSLVDLLVDGQARPVLIHDVQNHYLNDQPVHVDFYAVRMDEKLKARIPLHFAGESPAVKTLGGILVKNLSEVEVECLPADLPPFIEVDISGLKTFEDAVRVSDLKVSDKVKVMANPDELVITAQPPRSEAELEELKAAPVVEDVTKVEGVLKPETPAEGEEKSAAEVKEVKEEKAPKEKK